MKIVSANLLHTVSRNAGGLYESVRRLVQSLEEEDVGVTVFGVADKHTETDVGLWSPIKIQVFKPVWPESFGYSPSYLEEVENYAPNLVHTHGIWLYPSMAARRYCLNSGARSMISAHGMLDPWALRNSHWKKAIAYFFYEQAHLENATCLRALCQSEAESIRGLGLKNSVAVIPNGIDLPQKLPDGPAPWAGRGLDGRKILLYLGRIHPKKGLPELIRAWASLSREMPSVLNEWVLVIAGWDQGGHEVELKRLCNELSLPFADIRDAKSDDRQLPTSSLSSQVSGFRFSAASPSVLFLGPQFHEAKATTYHHSDAFILPSHSEGLPMVVLEAWAHRLPVLITPECNIPEGNEAGAAIRIATTTREIAEGLRQLFAMSAADRDGMAEKGRGLIVSKFNWRSIAKEMKKVYEWLLGGGAPPDCILSK